MFDTGHRARRLDSGGCLAIMAVCLCAHTNWEECGWHAPEACACLGVCCYAVCLNLNLGL